MPIRSSLVASTVVAAATSCAAADVTYSFSNATWAGFNFSQIFGPTAGAGGQPLPVIGTLTAVSVNATLIAGANDTFANDLCVYVRRPPVGPFGLLQVGGFSSLSAQQRYSWSNGGSDAAGTTVSDTRTLATPIIFTGMSTDPAIWLGNGWGGTGSLGTWTGSITLVGISIVPAPGALALAGALVLPTRGRRRP